MANCRRDFDGDTRFAVLPGVLHTNAVWGNGTTGNLLERMNEQTNDRTNE